MTRVIDPILADLQWEDAESSTLSSWRRHLVRTRAHLAFWRALTLHLLTRGFRPVTGATPSRIVALVVAVAAATLALTGALIAPPILSFSESLSSATPSQRARLVLYIIPQALSVAIPAGFLIGATIALVGRNRSRRMWIATVLVAGLCVVASVAAVWMTPPGNQAFRVLAFGLAAARFDEPIEPPERQVAELSRRELGERLNSLKEMQDLELPFSRWELYSVWFQYHLHVALPVAALFFAPLAIALSSRVRRRLAGAMWAFGAVLMWYFVLYGGRSFAFQGALSPALAAWAPNLAAAVVALALTANLSAPYERSSPSTLQRSLQAPSSVSPRAPCSEAAIES